MEWDEVVDKAVEYFDHHYGELEEVAEEVDNYSDYVKEHLYWESEYRPMDSLDDYFYGRSATDILNSISDSFDTSDEYFYDGGYSLESTDSPDYDYDEINDEGFIEILYDNAYRLGNLPEYIEKLFEAYDEGEEDEEDDDEI